MEKAKKFPIFAKNSIFDASTATGGGALVSGVLAPMDASKMPFLAKIGNFFTFEVRMKKYKNTKIQKQQKKRGICLQKRPF